MKKIGKQSSCLVNEKILANFWQIGKKRNYGLYYYPLLLFWSLKKARSVFEYIDVHF